MTLDAMRWCWMGMGVASWSLTFSMFAVTGITAALGPGGLVAYVVGGLAFELLSLRALVDGRYTRADLSLIAIVTPLWPVALSVRVVRARRAK